MKTRSAALARSAVDHGELTREDLSRDLLLSLDDVDSILDGSRVMSLPHQLCLSALLIERVPRLTRQAHTLRAQVVAARAFSEQRMESRPDVPMAWRGAR